MMETKEWHFIDKSSWAPGPWQSEPDKRQWIDPATGLPCLIVRGPVGALCGYVGIPRGHVFYGMDYSDVDVDWPHGGLTFASLCAPDEPEHGICHVATEGDDPHPWWLGFDCAHSGDLCPSYPADVLRLFTDLSYKDISFVTAECTKLAASLYA